VRADGLCREFDYHPRMPSSRGDELADFRALVAAAGEPIAVFGGGRLVFANAAMAECLGYATTDELEGATAAAFVNAHLATSEDAATAWFDEGARTGEARVSRRDGAVRVVRWRAVPLTFADGPARALSLRDVTDEIGARDLVFCYLMMPEMTGAELCRRLEAETPEVAPRVVLMTGGAASESLDAFLVQSSRPRLDKPFTPAELRTFVRLQLGNIPLA
jgi:PAS domain S-box-containing protein